MLEAIWISLDLHINQEGWKSKKEFYAVQTEEKRKEIINNALLEASIAQVKEDAGKKYQFEFSKELVRWKDINQIIAETTKVVENTGVNISNILNDPNEDTVKINIDISNFQSN